jgi:hypothetical protein
MCCPPNRRLGRDNVLYEYRTNEKVEGSAQNVRLMMMFAGPNLEPMSQLVLGKYADGVPFARASESVGHGIKKTALVPSWMY